MINEQEPEIIAEQEETILELDREDRITLPDETSLPDAFYEDLAKIISDKVYKDGSTYRTLPGHYYHSDEKEHKNPGANSKFIFAEIKKMYHNIPEDMINKSWKQIERFLNKNDLLLKLYDVSDRINFKIDKLRGRSYSKLYSIPAMNEEREQDPESYVDPKYAIEEKQYNYYTNKIEKELSLYLINLENALDTNLLIEKIEVFETISGNDRPTTNIGATNSLRFLAAISRGDNEAFLEALGNNFSRLTKKLKLKEGDELVLEPYERKILTKFGKALVRAHIKDAKERAKNLPEVYNDTYKEAEYDEAKNLIKEHKEKQNQTMIKKVSKKAGEALDIAEAGILAGLEAGLEAGAKARRWTASMFGWRGDNTKQLVVREKTKKGESPKRSSEAKGNVRDFIYRHATKSLMITTGATLIASGIYSGGLTILPMIGFAGEATTAALLLEATIGALVGGAFGKAASYISTPKSEARSTDNDDNDDKQVILPGDNQAQRQTSINHVNALNEGRLEAESPGLK